MNTITTKSLNKRERRAQQLLRHYEVCEALGRLMGMKAPDGKRISVALYKAERDASERAVYYSNGIIDQEVYDISESRNRQAVRKALGGKLPDGFFINSDPRGYALKIDDLSPIREQLLAIGVHRDMGGYFILSPEITGE